MAAKTPIRAVKDGSGNITGFSEYQSGEFLAVSQGGTGAITATAARTALGISIGSDVQAYDSDLVALAALTHEDSKFIVSDGITWVTESGATARTSLGLTIGTDVQAYDQQLTDVAGLTPSDGYVIIGDGTNFVTESGSTLRSSLGLAIGSDVQAFDANLDTIAGLTATNNYIIVGDGSDWTTTNSPTFTNLTVTGNLDIQSEIINSQAIIVTVDDAFVKLNNGNGEVDAGIIVETSDTDDARVFYDVSANRWVLGENQSYDEILTQSSTDTITNKTISGSSNTITNVPNSALSNSSFSVTDGSNTSAIALGDTVTFTGGAGVDISESSGTLSFTVDLSEITSDLNERIDDRIGSGMVVGGDGVTVAYDDTANTFTITTDLSEITTDLNERIDDQVATLITASNTSGIDITYDDAAGTLSFTTDLTEVVEALQDNIQNLFVGGTGITSTYDDGANTLTIDINFNEFDTDDITEGTTNIFYTEGRFDTSFAGKSTTDLTEGTNLYYTEERVDDRVAALLVDSATSGIDISYDDVSNQLTISSDLSEIVESLQDNVQGLFSGGTGITTSYDDNANTLSLSIDFTEFDTDDLVEGVTNLFHTTERVQDVTGEQFVTNGTHTGISFTYDDANDGAIDATVSLASFDTGDLAEGSNLYFTNERAQDAVGAMLSGNTETLISVTYDDANNIIDFVVDNDLSNYDNTTSAFIDLTDLSVATGSGLTYNNLTGEFGTSAIPNAQLANSSITINSYSTALGSSVTLVTDDIAEDGSPTNLWYTDARARASISVTDAGGDGSLSYNSSTGVITYTGPSQSEVLAHISGGTGVSIDAAGEISIDQAVGTTDNVTFNNVTVDGVLNSNDITAANISIDGNATITGNLTVEGTTTQVDSTTVTVADPLFKYAKDNTGNSVDIGFYGKYVQSATTKYAGLAWDASQSDKFRLFHGLQTEPTTTVDITATGHTVGTLIANLEGNVTGALTGNADTATALASGQNFSLTGDVTASAISFDGTGAVALSTSVTESAVTQHQAALAINESQITFTSNFLENLVEDTTPQLGGTLDANGNTIDMGVNVITDTKVGQWDTAYSWGDHASAGYLTSETSHADVLVDGDFTTAGIMATDGSGTYSIVTDNSTNWNTAYGWGDHSTAGYLTSFTETNDLTAAVTWANVPDANITESSVTQHQAALSITESQISDLGSYITATSTDTLTNKTINFENNTAIIEFAVTVSNPGAGNKYYLDGELSANIQLIPGVTYRFDQSDASNSTHPLVLSTTSESAGVTSYTTGVTTNGTPGSAGAYTQIVVDGATADKLYYYCSNHSGMGGGIVSIQGSSFVAGTGISISGETISSTITQYADADVEAYLSGGTGVTFSSGVISIGQAVGTADNVTFNDLIVSGDLTVSGTTTTVNTETIELADNIIVFNSNETGTPSQDAGIEIERGTDTNKTLLWNETDDKWTVGSETFVAGTFEGNLTGDVTGDIDGAIIITGKNESGSTIAANVPVYISGQSGSGTEFTVDVADADGSGTMPAIGITTASASDNASVSILTFGKFVGLDTSSFSVGDELYVSTTGVLTNTPPTGESASLQKIAKVTRSHASDGAIFVQGAGRTNAVPNLDDGDIFIGNASNQATTASFNTTVDGYLSGGTGIDYTTGAISVDSTVVTGQSALSGSVDTANDLILLYDNSSTSLTKVDVATLLASAGTGSFNDFNLAADTGTAEVVADGNTVTIAGGTGIDTVVSTSDTVTVAIDSTVITTSSSIGDLSDVDITTSAPSDGQALVWNATNSEFEPGTVASSTNYFQTVAVSGQSDVVPDSTTDTLNFAAGANITLTTDASTDTITIAATGGAANAFSTLAVAGQSNVVADSETDTLTFTAGTGMTITTDAGTDTITFESQGGGGGSLPVILSGSTSDPITLSDITVAGAIPFTNYDGTTDNIQLGSTQQAVTAFADNDADTSIEVERTSDNDTVYIKAGGTDVLTATSSGVTITNLTVTGNSVQANELKVTDTLFELNADGASLTTDAGMIVERGSTGDNAAFVWDESEDAWVAATTATDGSASSSLTLTEASLKAATQTQGDNSTNVATTAYVDTAVGSLSSNSITDADSDTRIRVEASADEDVVRVDTAGQERLTIDNNVSMSARGGFFTHNLTMDSNETFTIAATEGTVAAGPLDVQGTVDVQGSLVVL
jgi:hypothetical protein